MKQTALLLMTTLWASPAGATPPEGLFLHTSTALEWSAIAAFLLALVWLSKNGSDREDRGKQLTRRLIDRHLDKFVYRAFHDVAIPSEDGTMVCNHILVSPFGVFTVDSSHMDGRIYGRPVDPKWTRAAGTRKTSFPNPVRQSYGRTKALDALLYIGEHKIIPVIAFPADSEFRTEMPDNVTRGREVIEYVLSRKTVLLTESEQRKIAETLAALAPRSRTGSVRHWWENEGLMNVAKILAVSVTLVCGALLTANRDDAGGHAPAATGPVTKGQAILAVTSGVSATNQAEQLQPPHRVQLHVTAREDSTLTFHGVADNSKIGPRKISRGHTLPIEIPVGTYRVEIIRADGSETITVTVDGESDALVI